MWRATFRFLQKRPPIPTPKASTGAGAASSRRPPVKPLPKQSPAQPQSQQAQPQSQPQHQPTTTSSASTGGPSSPGKSSAPRHQSIHLHKNTHFVDYNELLSGLTAQSSWSDLMRALEVGIALREVDSVFCHILSRRQDINNKTNDGETGNNSITESHWQLLLDASLFADIEIFSLGFVVPLSERVPRSDGSVTQAILEWKQEATKAPLSLETVNHAIDIFSQFPSSATTSSRRPVEASFSLVKQQLEGPLRDDVEGITKLVIAWCEVMLVNHGITAAAELLNEGKEVLAALPLTTRHRLLELLCPVAVGFSQRMHDDVYVPIKTELEGEKASLLASISAQTAQVEIGLEETEAGSEKEGSADAATAAAEIPEEIQTRLSEISQLMTSARTALFSLLCTEHNTDLTMAFWETEIMGGDRASVGSEAAPPPPSQWRSLVHYHIEELHN
eukprot:PhM_4_TR18041/c0_g1_i3/m.97248